MHQSITDVGRRVRHAYAARCTLSRHRHYGGSQLLWASVPLTSAHRFVAASTGWGDANARAPSPPPSAYPAYLAVILMEDESKPLVY
ncbi:unnamed protein product, partial [Iphiclides podalirius]